MNTKESLQAHLAAIVEGSDDAIITKNLDSNVLSWNRGAERIFGYKAEEIIGRPITLLIPDDRQHEEVDFIARLRRGEHIDHFETLRQRKDGSIFPISLTVSPVRDKAGRVVAASKIARDITHQYEAARQKEMLLSEMRHRVGNTFAIAGGLLATTARQAGSAEELVSMMRDRLMALSAAHRLAVHDPDRGAQSERTGFRPLVASILGPFCSTACPDLDIEDVPLAQSAITPIAMVFYELCTNSVKYGALGTGGSVEIRARVRDAVFEVEWRESCTLGSISDHQEGFGTRMCRSTVESAFNGRFEREITAAGMMVVMSFDMAALTGADPEQATSVA